MMKGDDHCQCFLLQTFLQVLQVPRKAILPFITLVMRLKGLYLSSNSAQLLQILQLGIIVVIVHL